MNPCEAASLVTVLACEIFKTHSLDEVQVLPALFNQLGDTLATMEAHQTLCCPSKKE